MPETKTERLEIQKEEHRYILSREVEGNKSILNLLRPGMEI
jgi:hypothetical protein